MKRVLAMVLCVMMVLSILAGCGGQEDTVPPTTKHKHSHAEQWSFDDESHWYEAACGCNMQFNLANHEDANKDGACDVCTWVDDCTHDFNNEVWASDENEHWHPATCQNHSGAKGDAAAHADGDNDGACDICGYIGEHQHTYETQWSSDATQHWYAATCGHDVKDQLADHVDENVDGTCDVCGWEDPSHSHTFSDEWDWDVVFHWHPATCEHTGAMSGKAQHADTNSDDLCDDCGYEMCHHQDFNDDGTCELCGWADPEHVHEYAPELNSNSTGHWQMASCHSGANSPVVPHEDKNQDGVCDVCKFQICAHVFDDAWGTNETHHWHAVICSCSIGRKDYAEHTLDDTGACTVCMYGMKIPSVYEVLIDKEPVVIEFIDQMYVFQEFTVSFPQAGKYVLYPSYDKVKITEQPAFGNIPSDPAITIEVDEACEKTYYWYLFEFEWEPFMEVPFTYSLVRMDDVEVNTMQGKVELPANTVYRLVFKAPQTGTYNLITSVNNVVIGLTEDSMEYYKGHIDFDVTEVGQEVEFYVLLNDLEKESWIFDWVLEEPFSLDVSEEGNYAVSVDPKEIDFKINFTAPADGNYKLSVDSKWLTFCGWSEQYNQPTRLETTEIITGEMKAGEVYTIWLQTVYNYPESTNCAATLNVMEIGTVINVGQNALDPMEQGQKYTFIADETSYYGISVEGGYVGIIAPNGSVNWTTYYETKLNLGYSYTFMVRGEGVESVPAAPSEGAAKKIKINIEAVAYDLVLNEGTNTVTMKPAKEYDISFGEYFQRDENGEYAQKTEQKLDSNGKPILDDNKEPVYVPVYDENGNPVYLTAAFNDNQIVKLSWSNPRAMVYVNGEPYVAGTEIELMHNTFTITVLNNQDTTLDIAVEVTNAKRPDQVIEGEEKAVLTLHQETVLAIKTAGGKAEATFVAEFGGTYYFDCDTEGIIIKMMRGSKEESVNLVDGRWSFHMDPGETVVFIITAANANATMTIPVTVTNK